MVRIMIFIMMIFSFVAYADRESIPKPYIVTQEGMFESYYFKMIPENFHFEDDNLVIDSEAYGRAFRLNYDGTEEELWSVSGWHANNVYLAGKEAVNLVRLGNWARGQAPENEDLAVAFYERGKLLKSYSTADLIEKPDSVKLSVSHYQWKLSSNLARNNKYFYIETVENITYKFDVSTGEIVDVKLPNKQLNRD
ncbi:hypothetical protein HUZ36_18970 [Pseudoalteromonas sp. McH1-7]|uniref:hypothetical protein n=1 Tax=unclassified Pseudoalteromonas TaxID=194690 RepID=UPI000FFE7CE5|nr:MULTISPECIES: hypothetical protein [unclassified Pseudoalteromonas]NUZ12865.1 hypothetical protein [Pseudoalteromonas sp. McH1-7]RXE96112.1 hypothetical protein D9603_19230 [Pseudoalteromonas sp. PS5]